MGSPASMVETVPVGYRFHPTDEELVDHYLKHKLLGDDSRVHNTIAEVDVCKFEPWDLPAFSKVKSDDPEWFFFSPRGLKYTNSNRSNRATKAGYWKATGKDRNIKTRGTNNVIGTKKTLVFYKGRVPHAVKTNWVIHEYHAVTFPDDMRSFVLCRLMEKAEKKAEGGTHVLIHDEGEPSRYISADDENQATADIISNVYTSSEVNLESIFLARPQAEEYDFPTLQQSQIVIEQEPYFPGSTFPNVYFGNENSTMQFPYETTEEEYDVDLYLNSILADEDVFISKETTHTFVNDTFPSLSLRKEYYESSETDAELLSARHGNILDTTSSVCNEHTGSRENLVMSMVKSSHDAVHAAPPPLSSKNEVNLEKKDSTFDDDFWGVDDSTDITAIEPLPIFLIQSVSTPSPPRARSPSPSRRCESKYHPRSHNFVSQRAAARGSQAHRKVSSQAVSQQEAQKETHLLESNKEHRKAKGTSSRKDLETISDQSSGVNGKGSFIYLETPLSVNLVQHSNIPDTTTSMCNENTGSRENPVMSMVKSSHDAVYAGPPPFSPENEVNLENKDSTFDDDFWDLIANKPLSICVIQRVTSPSPSRASSPSFPRASSPPPRASSPSPSGRWKSEYDRRSQNFVSLRAAARRSQTQRKVSSQAVSQQEVQKETHILESNKEHRKAQVTSWRKKATSNQSSGVKGGGSFIYLETPLVQRSWFFFTWSCASSWHASEFHHGMMHKVKLKGVSQ